jgi:hypothetical protein
MGTNPKNSPSAGDQGVIADAPISVAIHEWDGSPPIKAEAPHGALAGLGAQLASASCQAKGDAAPVCQVLYTWLSVRGHEEVDQVTVTAALAVQIQLARVFPYPCYLRYCDRGVMYTDRGLF